MPLVLSEEFDVVAPVLSLALLVAEFSIEFKFSFPRGILLSDCKTDGDRFDCISWASWAVSICCLFVANVGAIGEGSVDPDPDGCWSEEITCAFTPIGDPVTLETRFNGDDKVCPGLIDDPGVVKILLLGVEFAEGRPGEALLSGAAIGEMG